jgi:hypothetical protein
VVILPLIDQFDNRLFINPIGQPLPLGVLPKLLWHVARFRDICNQKEHPDCN